jgi:hypothetical protein
MMMAIGKAKAKKITVSVGDRCDRQVAGVCLQTSHVYCVFDGKLARIIQEQGRRDQLGVKFGSGTVLTAGDHGAGTAEHRLRQNQLLGLLRRFDEEPESA